MTHPAKPTISRAIPRRAFLGASLSTGAALACNSVTNVRARRSVGGSGGAGGPVLVGSANGLPGMQKWFSELGAGADPLQVAIDVVKIVEANPNDTSVGLGGLPNEDGVVQLDAAVMHGPTHNSGAVASIENILHPSEVARLVMERTDHCLIVGPGAYEFARMHGHPHTELLTESTRKKWLAWRETVSDRDDRFPARDPERQKGDKDKSGQLVEIDGEKVALEELFGDKRPTGTIHCSALSPSGDVACTTTTSGLAWKVPGRVGDSPIVGAGLYCDQEVGSAGATGRGEAAVLSNGSFAIVELMRGGASPEDAGLEVLDRIAHQARRASVWQPALIRADGQPSFNIQFYAVALDGRFAGVSMRGKGSYAVATTAGGARHEKLRPLF